MTVDILSRGDWDLRIMHGRACLNLEERELLFLEDGARGPRSKEVMRTDHGRLVKRPDGNYTLTFRFSPDETDIEQSLMDEMLRLCIEKKNK